MPSYTLTVDEIIYALAGYTVEFDFVEETMKVEGGSALPDDVKATLKFWKETRPAARQVFLERLWNMAKPAPVVPEDALRCPSCPNRGRRPWNGTICSTKCPKQVHKVRVPSAQHPPFPADLEAAS